MGSDDQTFKTSNWKYNTSGYFFLLKWDKNHFTWPEVLGNQEFRRIAVLVSEKYICTWQKCVSRTRSHEGIHS